MDNTVFLYFYAFKYIYGHTLFLGSILTIN